MQAKLLYDTIEDSGGFYNSPVDPAVRSRMNVPFTIPANADLEPEFIKGAAAEGLVRLVSHTTKYLMLIDDFRTLASRPKQVLKTSFLFRLLLV